MLNSQSECLKTSVSNFYAVNSFIGLCPVQTCKTIMDQFIVNNKTFSRRTTELEVRAMPFPRFVLFLLSHNRFIYLSKYSYIFRVLVFT